jgi:hypothetical protein
LTGTSTDSTGARPRLATSGASTNRPDAALIVALLFLTGVIGGWGAFSPATIAADQTAPAAGGAIEPDFGGLPPGDGREEDFYTCQACHSLKTVLQQRLSRDVWDETLVWMVEEQGMPQPEPEDYARILGYLGAYLAPETPR